MITNIQAVEYAKKAIGCEYWYGTFGQKATNTLLNERRKAYPSYYNRANYTKGWTCDDNRVFDCIGLAVKGPVWSGGNFNTDPKYIASQDVNVGGMYQRCTEKGNISTIPETPGILVFKGDLKHIGLYEGNGNVIEAKGHNYGVCRTKLSAGSWKYWAKCPWFTYSSQLKSSTATTTTKPIDLTKAVEDALKTALSNIYTHKVKSALNVRGGHSALSKKIKYKDFPEYIKKQMTVQYDYLPAGIKIICFENYKGWYKIDDKSNIWVAGNYTTKL